MADLDALALALPETTKEVSADGRPSYLVGGKMFCCHRTQRKDAVDAETGERLDDVLLFRVQELEVKEALIEDGRGIFFTTPHFRGYPAVLVRIPSLADLGLDELEDLVVDAWLTRAPKRVANTWLAD
jgi:hypothetical protein